ncbi:lactonase family protein [Robbsia andropogonis]|uniref:lactonase family protein n=1 Tax=Robbsia andropogonis TaxID=28092 RepID=UPI003D19FCD6
MIHSAPDSPATAAIDIASPMGGQPYYVLVSNALDGAIGVYRMDRETGALTVRASLETGDAVSALAPSPDGRYVFAVTKGPKAGGAGIAVFAGVDAAEPFSLLHHTPIAHPLAYLTVDPSGHYLVGASYHQHAIVLYRVTDIVNGHGDPVQVVGDIGHAHSAVFSANGRDLYIAALGDDAIHAFALQTYPTLTLEAGPTVTLPAGFGPRHLRLSASETRLLVLSELQGTLATVSRNPDSGALGDVQVAPIPDAISHLHPGAARGPAKYASKGPARPATCLPPEDHHVEQTRAHTFAPVPDTSREGDVWAADIHVSPDGRFVYTSERTTSQLIGYRHRADAHAMGNDTAEPAIDYFHSAHTETQPRGFRIDPQGRFLVACGERSQLVSVYRINVEDGALQRVAQVPGGRGANWIEILAPR